MRVRVVGALSIITAITALFCSLSASATTGTARGEDRKPVVSVARDTHQIQNKTRKARTVEKKLKKKGVDVCEWAAWASKLFFLHTCVTVAKTVADIEIGGERRGPLPPS